MARFHDPMSLLFAIDKHRVAGIVVIVIGALVATYGVLRALKRVSGAALIALSGVAIAVVGVLVSTHTIHG
jgi:hypothetical membrane protein